MTNKNPGKVQEQPRAATPSEQEVQMAYQVHTLAQMLYGYLASTNPWVGPAQALMPYEPLLGPQYPAWAVRWPADWGVAPLCSQPGAVPCPMILPVFPH
jgi:hypothetical protein